MIYLADFLGKTVYYLCVMGILGSVLAYTVFFFLQRDKVLKNIYLFKLSTFTSRILDNLVSIRGKKNKANIPPFE